MQRRQRWWRWIGASFVFGLLALTGCGSTASTKDAVQTLVAWNVRVLAKDPKAVKLQCGSFGASWAGEPPGLKGLRVLSVHRSDANRDWSEHGDHVAIEFRDELAATQFEQEDTWIVNMAFERGAWRVCGLDIESRE